MVCALAAAVLAAPGCGIVLGSRGADQYAKDSFAYTERMEQIDPDADNPLQSNFAPTVTNPDGTPAQYTFDENGNPVAVTTPPKEGDESSTTTVAGAFPGRPGDPGTASGVGSGSGSATGVDGNASVATGPGATVPGGGPALSPPRSPSAGAPTSTSTTTTTRVLQTDPATLAMCATARELYYLGNSLGDQPWLFALTDAVSLTRTARSLVAKMRTLQTQMPQDLALRTAVFLAANRDLLDVLVNGSADEVAAGVKDLLENGKLVSLADVLTEVAARCPRPY